MSDDPIIERDRCYTRSTQPAESSVEVEVTVPPEVAELLAALVASGDFPDYESVGDFMRDAAVHRLEALRGVARDGEAERSLEDLLGRVSAMEDALRPK